MCSIDLRKAFDKVNHCGLHIKLIKRFVPTALMEVIENWLSNGMIAVRSCSVLVLVNLKVLYYRPIFLLCISTMSEKNFT